MILRLYPTLYLSVMLLTMAIFLFHFGFIIFSLLFVLLGILLRAILKKNHLLAFSFLIPILPAFASLHSSGFPKNYLILPLLVLTGIVIADSIINKEVLAVGKEAILRHYIYYLLILSLSFIFVILRWSNLTLSPLAFLKDTPIAPTGQRISFGIIFPVVELALFSLSPLYYLLLKRQSDLRRILVALLAGQSLSIFYSLFQRLHGKKANRILLSGLSSDATAFGFLSALAILLSWYLYSRCHYKKSGILFAFISLSGILNSSTRIGLLAVIMVFFLFVFTAKKKVLSFILITALLVISSLLYLHFLYKPGFNFLTRLKSSFGIFNKSLEQKEIDLKSIQNLTSKRDTLLRYSLECLRSFPLTGVGTGNFVFWVMSAHQGKFFHHLPANQYFFVTSSTGLIGLSVFLLFCFALFRRRKWPEKWLLGIFLFLLIFNDYLWFPEIFLVFWLFAALGEENEKQPLDLCKWPKTIYSGVFVIFIIFNLLSFSKLHPKNWAREALTSYDYGFSYLEKEGDHRFRWSGEQAGAYVFLDKDHPKSEYKLTCGAPLSRLPGKQQSVDVYWRGEFLKRMVFRKNGEMPLRISDKVQGEGFLEFRVRPVFNLNKMGLGAESRNMGVQASGRGISDNSSVFTLNFASFRGPKTILPVDLSKTVPPLKVSRIRGQFTFSLSAELMEQVLLVSPPSMGKNGKMLIFFGFQLNSSVHNLTSEPVRMVTFRAVMNLSDPENMAVKILVQDKIKNWEKEFSKVDRSGWQHYFVEKRIRENAKGVFCGILWEPHKQSETIKIREFQIIVN